MTIDKIEEFFEIKNIKNFQRNHLTIFWIVSIFLVTSIATGYASSHLMTGLNLPDYISNIVAISFSLLVGGSLSYIHRHIRVCVITIIGIATVASVVSLIWKSGIFLHV